MSWGIFDSLDASDRDPQGLQELTVHSPALGRRGDITVYGPADSDAEGLPLVVLLHGVYGSHWSWSRMGRAHETLSQLVAAGLLRPTVLAMPSDGLFGIGSGYLDRDGERAGEWITHDVPAAVRYLYPSAGDGGQAIAGLSMGGWGALRLAALKAGQYVAAVGMSPLTEVGQIADYAEHRRTEHAPHLADPDLGQLLVRSQLPPVMVTCGAEDPLVAGARRLHDTLSGAGVEHKYLEGDGGHDWPYWTRTLRDALLFIEAESHST